MLHWAFLEEHVRSKSIYDKVITGYLHAAHDALIVHALLAPSPFIQAVTSVPKYTRRLDFTTGKRVDRGRILRVAKQ